MSVQIMNLHYCLFVNSDILNLNNKNNQMFYLWEAKNYALAINTRKSFIN